MSVSLKRAQQLPQILQDAIGALCDLSEAELAHIMAALPHEIGSLELHFDRDRIKVLPRAKAAERDRRRLQLTD